jgi:hypothetical protein
MGNLGLILRAAVGLPLGFFLPGYLLARLLTSSDRWLWAFPLSLITLFLAIFCAGVLGQPLGEKLLADILLLVVFALLGLGYLWGPAISTGEPTPSTEEGKSARWLFWGIVIASCILYAVVIWRMMNWPLAGPDTPFRWDLLAQRMLERHSFAFYPPIKAADFQDYFYTDGIPPVVSFSYWWLYVTTGGHHAALTGILIAAQLANIAGFAWSMGRRAHSPRAGLYSAGIVGASTLIMWGTAIGEEGGITLLSMAAMLSAVTKVESRTDWRSAILVGLTGALGALAREYALVIPMLGCVALLWRGMGWKNAAIAGVAAFAVAAPWYIRNALLTGNPLFSNRFLDFYVNPVHAQIMDFYREQMGISTWTAADWLRVGQQLLCAAPLQCTLGILAAAIAWRHWGYIAVITVVFAGLWLYSIGFSVGGASNILISGRVFAPALFGLSVLGGVALACCDRSKIVRWGGGAIILAGIGWSIVVATIFPADLTAGTFKNWGANFVARKPPLEDWWSQLPQVLPSGTRILSDDAYIYAGLDHSGLEIVPVWSPEVQFINDSSLTPRQVRQKMLEHNIRFVIFELDLNGAYLLQRVPFYSQDMGSWRLVAHTSPDHSRLYELTPDN